MASSSTTNGFAGLHTLDRKAMEEERLARLAHKRMAAAQDDAPPRKAAKAEHRPPTLTADPTPSKPPIIDLTSDSLAHDNSPQNETAQSSLQFPDGVVRKTWAFGHPRNRDIKIEEVLQKDTLTIAVLSSYQWNMEWIFSKLNMAKTKVELIMQAKEAAVKAQYRSEAASWSKSLRIHFPPMPGQVWCLHSKLMLLFHPNRLRIVVPTANLVHYDWGESGIMENTVFLIDLPRLPEEDQQDDSNATLTPFGSSLLDFLDAMHIKQDVRKGVLKFDFTKTASFAFIHTIGGSHSGDAAFRTGYPSLSNAVRSLNLQVESEEPLELDFVASSLGALNEKQLLSITQASRGIDTKLQVKSTAKPGAKETSDNLRIYFPTLETVQNSAGGTRNGGTICLQRKWYDSATFPKTQMRDCVSQRKGLLSHNKILFVRAPRVAWAYIGSANLSESAWGGLSIDKKTKQPKLNCRNWECGVLVPAKLPANEADIETASEDSETQSGSADGKSATSPLGMEVFKPVLDIPFEWPGKPYGGRQPWLFME